MQDGLTAMGKRLCELTASQQEVIRHMYGPKDETDLGLSEVDIRRIRGYYLWDVRGMLEEMVTRGVLTKEQGTDAHGRTVVGFFPKYTRRDLEGTEI